MTWTLPNILTVVRLIAAPGLALAFLLLSRPAADWAVLVLFIGAAITDWVDGRIARGWNLESAFGAMLDPIADKAMVLIALLLVAGASGLDPLVTFPATLIVFREVFVSGLREFLGATAGTLKVTRLGKWKTTAQMAAIALLLSTGLFEHYLGMQSFGMDREMLSGILSGSVPDDMGLVWKYRGMIWSNGLGTALLWIAAGLTLISGADYFVKALPHLRETDR